MAMNTTKKCQNCHIAKTQKFVPVSTLWLPMRKAGLRALRSEVSIGSGGVAELWGSEREGPPHKSGGGRGSKVVSSVKR